MKLDELVKEQRRTNMLLERIANQAVQGPTKKPWMCDTGKSGRCFGPWYVCAIFGCAVR
jgi:hypothetical protein